MDHQAEGANKMFLNEPFTADISRINLAHEFILDAAHKCEYLNGRKMFGMVFCISGTAEYKFNSGERLTVEEGDALFLAPDTAYSILTHTAFRHFTINFDVHKKSSDLDIMGKPYCLLRRTDSDQLERLFGKLVKAWTQKNAGYKMLSISHLYALISLFYYEYKKQLTPSDHDARLQPAKDYVEQNFSFPITLEQLAKLCNMSVTNFRREWQKAYHVTPIQYRDEIRISYAKEYLICGYYSVSEVAARCGFDDPGYFIRFFEKHIGMTPGAFKKRFLLNAIRITILRAGIICRAAGTLSDRN